MGKTDCHGFCSTMLTRKYVGRSAAVGLSQGFKICRTCDTMIFTDRKYCPCCGYQLSTRFCNSKPNNIHAKRI